MVQFAVRQVMAWCTVLMLAGCGTFQLASDVRPTVAKTQEQQQLDMLACKDQAKLEANTAGRQAGAFALGFTIVGAPIAFEMEKAKQREVFASCMTARGYAVSPPRDGATSPAAPATPVPVKMPPPVVIASPQAQSTEAPQSVQPVATSAPVPAARDEAAQLQKLRELLDRGLISQAEYEKKRKEILDRL
jgi:hypothetical protein